MTRVYRFGWGAIDDLPDVAAELGLSRLVLVTSARGRRAAAHLDFTAVYDGIRSHVPRETVVEAAGLARAAEADGLVGLGGGSAIDTCKAVAASLLEEGFTVKTIAVPTTYAGAEWTTHYGVLDVEARQKRGGADERVRPVAALYDPALTVGLPASATAGTAMNALAHCVEALYANGRTDAGDRHAFCGARAISHALPLVLGDPASRYARARLLEGAMRSAWALAEAGMAIGHAMAQTLGARYGIPHGVANAICLPPALRFNVEAVPAAVEQLAEAMGVADPVARVEELSALGGFGRLRDLGVPEGDLDELAELAAARPAARGNPRPADAGEVVELLRSVW